MADRLPAGYVVCATPGCAVASQETHCREHRFRAAERIVAETAEMNALLETSYASVTYPDGTVLELEGARDQLLGIYEGPLLFRVDHPGRPVPWQRTRNGRRTEPRYAAWKAGFVEAVRAAVAEQAPMGGPVVLDVEVSPTGVRVELRPAVPGRPEGLRGDADNYLKAIADGLTEGGAYPDDAAVVAAHVRLVGGDTAERCPHGCGGVLEDHGDWLYCAVCGGEWAPDTIREGAE